MTEPADAGCVFRREFVSTVWSWATKRRRWRSSEL